MNHVFKWITYILVEVKSFSDGVADFFGKKTCFFIRKWWWFTSIFGVFADRVFPPWWFGESFNHGNHEFGWSTWWLGFEREHWRQWPDEVVSMTATVQWFLRWFFKCFFFKHGNTARKITFELYTLFCGLNFKDLEVASSLRLEVLVSQLKTQVWRQTVDENFDFLVSLGCICTYQNQNCKIYKEAIQEKRVQATPSCSQNAFWVLELGGCWGRQWNWHVFLVEKAIWMFPKIGVPSNHPF